MFDNVITSTPFTGAIADSVFASKVWGDSYQSCDVSLITTLRATLNGKIPGDRTLRIRIRNVRPYISGAKGELAMCGEYEHEDLFAVTSVNGATDEVESYFNEVKNLIESDEAFASFALVPKVAEFFRKIMNILVCVNPINHTTHVFIENMNVRRLHAFQSGIFACIPWYFTKDTVTPADMEIVMACRESDSSKYISAIEKCAAQINFRDTAIKNMLQNFESSRTRHEISRYEDTIENYNSNLENLEDRIREILVNKYEAETMLAGLMSRSESASNGEVMEYFLCNKCLYLEEASDDGTIIFDVSGAIEYYDEEMAATIINNSASYLYRFVSQRITNEDMMMLLKAIFLERKLKINSCAAYSINIMSGPIGLRDRIMPSCISATSMPNPHIDGFSCMGNYVSIVTDLIKHGKYVEAIEQCIASEKSLNFGDPSVMRRFMEMLYGNARNASSDYSCIMLPDGSIVTPVKAIEYLKQEAEHE